MLSFLLIHFFARFYIRELYSYIFNITIFIQDLKYRKIILNAFNRFRGQRGMIFEFDAERSDPVSGFVN